MKFSKAYNFLLVFLFLIVSHSGLAQELLTAEEAVAIALENNFQIKIVANELEIDETAVSPGLAGMLPQVNAVVDNNRSQQDITQVRSDGTEISRNNAKNNSLSYGVELDWTIFDGLRMFARYDQLKEIKNLGEAELKQAILVTVSDVMTTYYDLVQQQQQLTALDSTLVISRQRVDLANNRFEIGKASKLELLNAQVDENTDQTLYLRQQELYENTKTRLNEILGRDVKEEFKVVDIVVVDADLFLPKLEELAQEQNPQLQVQIINKRIAELQFKQVRAARFPIISAQTGYILSDSENSLGFTTSNNVQGFNYGFSATLNIFDGFNQNRNEKIARIQIENSELVIEQQTQTLLSQLSTAYQTYSTNLLLMDLEEKNEDIAKENLDITMAKYKIGTIPTIEFRTAQLNYINAVLRSSNAAYEAKLSEITLKELAGNLTL
ncbi:TolC family protein [Aequorivita echinoideorum]|uniref:TolC family protein n=1 Tax=Aequorivita echinoideorum TaxID=1549647 RepID=A0ABS5S6I4_9FLAO|nr:TolC family protein [Aequorivita echinoideorum]MBT0608803.1 TolC family protein [Aequorivita echinoideorum]